jgi:hypothetical protein
MEGGRGKTVAGSMVVAAHCSRHGGPAPKPRPEGSEVTETEGTRKVSLSKKTKRSRAVRARDRIYPSATNLCS